MSAHYSILVVDDVPANVGLLIDALARDFQVLVSESAESCLEQLPHGSPDLILLDMIMPGRSGLELCRELKRDPRWAGIPVIFMTAVDDPEQKRIALEEGAVDYVTKPIYVPEVIARVRTHLRILSLNRELQKQNEALELEVLMRRETEAQLEQSLDRGLIAASPEGQVLFITRRAEHLVQLYYGGKAAVVLPEMFVLNWQRAREEGRSGWRKSRTGSAGQMIVRLFHNPEVQGVALLHVEEEGSASAAIFRRLGLSPRECEVLYWMAEGKTYPEIAEILSAAVRTVHKHAENLLRKLNVESRSAAMRIALDLLGGSRATSSRS